MSDKNLQRLAWALFVVWLAAYGWSFISFEAVEPTGDGFTRGLNRVTAFLGWQMVAGVVAVLLWPLGRRFPAESAARWLIRVPLILAGLLLLAIAGLIAFASFNGP